MQSIAIILDLIQENSQDFSIEVLLQPGENRINLIATILPTQILARALATDQHIISLTYLPELLPEAAENGYFHLSDGTQTKIRIQVYQSVFFQTKISKI